MVRSYRNGEVPSEWLIQFASGYNSVDGAWVHSLPPSTYRKHLALVALAKRNTGRDLNIGVGWCAYRPLGPQKMLKKRFGVMAADPGTSSHGLFWEGAQVAAIDYSNWSHVYNGDRAAWFRDVRAVGLVPDMISPRRGYPDEPWHVIDRDPWAAVVSGGGSSAIPPLPEGKTMSDVKQIHCTTDNKPGGPIRDRAFLIPGTPWAVPFSESSATTANAGGAQFETGDSVWYSQSMFKAFIRASERCAPTALTIEIVDADS